jgi:hypothetical protein
LSKEILTRIKLKQTKMKFVKATIIASLLASIHAVELRSELLQ